MSEQTPSIEQNDPASIVAEPAEDVVSIPFQVPAPIDAEMLPVESLSPGEMSELGECERTIAKGLKAFVEVGNALLRVQESRLYRGDYATFDLYLEERWGLSRSRAYQLINASKVAYDLQGDPSLAQIMATLNEGQARELSLLKEPEQRREAAKLAVKDKGEGRVTAKGVREAAAQVSGKSSPTHKAKARTEPQQKADKSTTEKQQKAVKSTTEAQQAVKPKLEPPKADKPVPVVTTGQPPAGRVEVPMLSVTGPEPAVEAATQPGEQYPPEEYPLTEAVRGLFRSPIPDSARNSVERLLASDPYKVSLGDADDLIRRCGLGRVEIVISVPQEPLATASA